MKKYTLGLDIGTNSIGWALLEDNNIIDKGVNIFPIGTNLIKGIQEETKNSQRGGYRRAKRNLFRYKLRRKELRKLLTDLKMLPNFAALQKLKEKYQASELYQLRADALDKQIPEEEIGRLFLLINKHRGFKSNSKTLSEKDDEEGVVKDGIHQLQSFMDASDTRTVGEYFHTMYKKSKELYNQGKWHNIDEPLDERAKDIDDNYILQNSRGIRKENGRYVARSMYEKEFDLIWDEQKKYYPQLSGSRKEYDEICKLPVEKKRSQLKSFKTTAYWKIRFATIFYQRSLKSQKKYIGKCQFETKKRTSPISSLLFQEFRIWKQLADVRYSDKEKDIYNQSLPYEWKQKLADYLEIHPKLNLREGNKKKDGTKNIDVMDILCLSNKKNYEFNFDNSEDDKTFEGNKTLYAIYNACGEQIYTQLKKENKLENLWHLLYMAKDDEWLKDTLSLSWNFDEEIANRLVEMGLEEGFASYSSKVLKKIFPYMKEGKDEFDALVLSNYRKAPDEVKQEGKLKEKIIQLRNNELRNPVVEKAVCQIIRLVNAILKNKDYQIDQEKLIIRIESTREFKKPKNEREKIRRGNTETDKKRDEYANFLNEKRKEGKLKFARDIYKNDSLINKFELWLEMGMDKEDPSFSNFNLEKKASEKHILWLECNRICPYTGKAINLTKLFSSDVEIEHIIPYSRSLDDSFVNKTITFSEVNKEKGNKTAYEYIKSKGEQAFSDFKTRVKVFGKEKREGKFLIEKVPTEFSNAQITNTSYIAKYVRNKLQEVCRDVQFTNGAATGELRKNDWRLGDLLDKIRYEEETQIDIDEYLGAFKNYKKDFDGWRKKKNNSTDLTPINWKEITPDITSAYEEETKNPLFEWWNTIQKFDTWRGAKGKKDRSDHRHHLLDAIITACCSRSIIQKLSTLNAAREKNGYAMYDERGFLTREKIECPLIYKQIKDALKDNLIFHKAEQRLLTSKVNKIKRKRNHPEDSIYLKQKTYSVRGSLVGDNFYGKLKNPRHQGFEKDSVFVKRVTLSPDNFKDEKSLDKIVDANVREILKRRLALSIYNGKGEKAFSEESLINDPVFLFSLKAYPIGIPEKALSKNGLPLPVIKKVRVANKNARNLVQLTARDECKNVVNENRYAEADGNFIMALYESKSIDKKGKIKIKRDFEIISFYEAIKRRKKGEKLFSDEKIQKDGTSLNLMINCPSLKQGEMVLIFNESEDEIDWTDVENLKRKLYKVTELGLDYRSENEQYGTIKFARHNKQKTVKDSYSTEGDFIKKLHTGINAIKVKVSNLGKIERVMELTSSHPTLTTLPI